MKPSDSVLRQKDNKKADSLNYEHLGLSSENNSVFENNTAHNTHRVYIYIYIYLFCGTYSWI